LGRGDRLERERLEHEDAKREVLVPRPVAAELDGDVHVEAEARRAHIGTLNEKPLHAALKNWYGRPGDQFEVRVDGFFIDIVQPRAGEGDLLVEIQTKNLFAMKRKLNRLVETHEVRLVYPVGQEKWIVRMGDDGEVIGRRRSPKRGGLESVFAELVSFPRLLVHPNFTLEVLLIREEEVRVRDETVNWRRKGWATSERRLLEVVGSHVFEQPADLLALVPSGLPDPFTPVQLARALDRPAWLARKMTYCLREMGMLAPAGKRGRSNLFARTL
jgi:hypothetical protein